MDVRARRADLARPPGRRLAGSLHGTREMSAAADRPTDPGRPARQAFTVGVGPHACPGEAVATAIAAAGVRPLLARGVEPERLLGHPADPASAHTPLPGGP